MEKRTKVEVAVFYISVHSHSNFDFGFNVEGKIFLKGEGKDYFKVYFERYLILFSQAVNFPTS